MSSLAVGLISTGTIFTGSLLLSPRHHFILALQEIPVASSVKVNSIIAVEGNGPVTQGDDTEPRPKHDWGIMPRTERSAIYKVIFRYKGCPKQ